MAASLLTAEPLTLANVPRLADVRAMAELLISFGVGDPGHHGGPGSARATRMRLQARQITSAFASYDMVRKMRASFQVLAPLLARARRGQGLAARRLRHRRAAGRSAPRRRWRRWAPRSSWRTAMSSPTRTDGLKGARDRVSLRLGRRHRNRDDGGDAGQGHDRDRQCRARAGDRRSRPLPDRDGREDLRPGHQRDHGRRRRSAARRRTSR